MMLKILGLKDSKKELRKHQLYFLIIYLLLANLLVLAAKPTYLGNLFIVYAVPMLVTFSWLKNETKQKILLFSLMSVLLFAPPIELMARLADSWDVQTSLPKIYNISPFENLIYAFINFVFPLSFYKHFTEHDKKSPLSENWKVLIILMSIFTTIVHIAFALDEELITMHYWQIAVIFLAVPATILYLKNKEIIFKSVPTTIFFAATFFIHELVSMKVGHWWWPGDYILPASLGGQVFPVDDVLIWYFLSTPVLIGGFEFFFDDFK